MRQSAAVALAGFDDNSGVEMLLSALQQQPLPPIPEVAALIRLQEPRTIPLLIPKLHAVNEEIGRDQFDIETEDMPDVSADARTETTPGSRDAILSSHDQAVSLLQENLTGMSEPTDGCSSFAAQALSSFGETAEEPLLDALHDPSPSIRSGAGFALGLIGDPRALPALIADLQDPQPAARRGAIAGLADMEDVRAVPPLLAALSREKNSDIKLELYHALAEFREPEILTAFLPLCRNRDEHLRLFAVSTVRKFNDPRVLPCMLAALRDRNFDVRDEVTNGGPWAENPKAITALVRALPYSAGPLLHLRSPVEMTRLLGTLKSTNLDQRATAILKLSLYRDPRVVNALIRFLGDKYPDMRGMAITALGTVIGPQDLPHLLPFLTTLPTADDRINLVSILGAAGGAAVAPLAELAQDESPEVRTAAAKALGSTGDPGAIDPLLSLLKDPYGDVRFAALNAIGAIDGPRAFEARLSLLHDIPITGPQFAFPQAFRSLHTVSALLEILSAKPPLLEVQAMKK